MTDQAYLLRFESEDSQPGPNDDGNGGHAPK